MNYDKLRYRFSRANITTRLVAINIVVFVVVYFLDKIFGLSTLVNSLMLSPNLNLLLRKPWSLLTYIFLHWDLWHLLGNMLWMYFIGIILEDLIGGKHIRNLFLWGGIVGGILFVLLYQLPFFNHGIVSYMRGASAGVTAIVVGTAVFVPRYKIYLFGVLPIELMWIAVIRVLFDILSIGNGINAGGYIAHLGGAIFGFVYIATVKGIIKWPWGAINKPWGKKPVQKPRRKFSVQINEEGKSGNSSVGKPSQSEIDEILDKINQSGYESLTRIEKEKLFKAGE